MVPFGLDEEQFVARYRKVLEQTSAAAIERIASVLIQPVPPTVASASVEAFMGENGAVPSVWIYFLGENNKVDHKDKSIFPGRAMELNLPLDRLSEFDERYFESEQFRGTYLAANALKGWFAECWWKAGGWQYSVPTTFQVHDALDGGTTLKLSNAGA